MKESELPGNEDWDSFKESLMAVAIESQERSTLEVIDQDELGHKLGLDTSATEQKERLSVAVGELVQEGRLKSKSRNDEFLSLGKG